MAKRRISKSVEARLLFENRHTCCICRKERRPVQLHHIDGNPTNDKVFNLAVLCVECHSDVSGDAGLGRRYTADEIRRYKRDWEGLWRKRRGVPVRMTRVRGAFKKAFWSCEVRKLAHEINSADEKADIDAKLDVVESISLFEGMTIEVLDAYEEILSVTAFGGSRIPVKIIQSTVNLVAWLPGPKEVPMGPHERKMLKHAVEVWSTMGGYASELNRNRLLLVAIFDASVTLFDLAVNYRQIDVARVLANNVWTFGENCHITWEKGEKPFKSGRQMSRRTLRKMAERLQSLGKPWAGTKALITRRLRAQSRAARVK